jgi:hypothetical protein
VEKWIESVEKFKNGLPWGQKKDEGILWGLIFIEKDKIGFDLALIWNSVTKKKFAINEKIL